MKAKNDSRYFPKLAGVSTSVSEPCLEKRGGEGTENLGFVLINCLSNLPRKQPEI